MADTDGKAARAGGGIQSLERGSAILDAVAASPRGIGLAELSAAVGLHTSTTFHLARTLAALGFIDQDASDKRYRVGGRLFTLAAGALDEKALLRLGTPVLEALSEETGEAAHLAVRSRHEIVLVARTPATGMLQMSERAGLSRPAHATAIGKLLLSELDEGALARFLAAAALPRLTAGTITDPDALREELAGVRAGGVAHDRCEMDPEVRCVAVAVRDFAGRCVAAMGISGPRWRMGEDALPAKLERLRGAAEALSERLGHREEKA